MSCGVVSAWGVLRGALAGLVDAGRLCGVRAPKELEVEGVHELRAHLALKERAHQPAETQRTWSTEAD